MQPPIKIEDLKVPLKKAMNSLGYREREIIKLLNGLDNNGDKTLEPMSIEEVAHDCKITPKRVEQLAAMAMRKLSQQKRPKSL